MKHIFSTIFFLFISFFVFAQKNDIKFKSQIDSILITKPETYKDINDYLRPFRRDTNKLKVLAKRFEAENYLSGKSYAENLLGIQYRYFGQNKKAIAIHKQALATATRAKSIEFRVFSLNMLGVDYRKIDANRTALDYNSEALSLAESVAEPNLGLKRSIAVSLNSMGNIYLLLKQYDLAIERFKRSQKIEKSINNKLGLAINYANIGYAKEAQSKTTEALNYFEQSLAINNEINNKYGQIICNSNIARMYIKDDKPNEAIKLIEANLKTAKELGNTEYLAYEHLNLGWAQTKIKQFDKAENNLQTGLEYAEKHDYIAAKSSAYSHFAELYQQKKEYKKALEYFKLSNEFEDEITNERTIQYVNDLIIKYDSERQKNQIEELASQNEIKQLQLDRTRNIWIIISIASLLFFSILYILYRQRLLKKQKRILTLEQDVLRTQMNPHFIFNALNSIKHYIINNEQKNAVHYLNKFSKLVRKILESTSVKEVTLAEELETMDLYMNIENIRFSNEINFEMNVDNTIDLTSVTLPPLVLQPFLENALWHGLSSKKGDKKIVLNVLKTNDNFIQIDIIDNGIGRTASAKIKSKKVTNRKSIGIDLTKERLHNFIKDFKNDFSLIFQDLVDENNTAKGTKVILRIPTL